MADFNVGDKVICVDAYRCAYKFTIGKIYEVCATYDYYIGVVDDKGHAGVVSTKRFKNIRKPTLKTVMKSLLST